MNVWYVRDRGRVVGPLTAGQLREMRDTGQVQGYHEVSRDKRVWRALDLETGLDGRDEVIDPDPWPPDAPPARVPFRLIVGGVVALLVVGVGVGVWLLVRANLSGAAVPAGAIRFTPTSSAKHRDGVLKQSVGLVVAGIRVASRAGRESVEIPAATGSGFLISPDGHLLTNRHVVEDVEQFELSRERREAEAKYKVTIEPCVWVLFGRDQKHVARKVHISREYDCAIYQLDGGAKHFFALCDTVPEDIPKLRDVSAIGFPGADRAPINQNQLLQDLGADRGKGVVQDKFPERAFEFTERRGAITNRAFRNVMEAAERESVVIQHDAQIHGGNSGGPLIANDGTVLGVNTWSHKKRAEANYALTMPQLRSVIDRHVPGAVWRGVPD